MIPHSLILACLLTACGASAPPPDRSVESAGAYAVGTERIVIGTRVLQAWYPSESPVADVAIETLEAEPTRARYASLLAAASDCPTRRLEVALDGVPAAGPFPLVLASHCHSCTRLSNATTAIRLASHGVIVVSVDHVGDTLWDQLDGREGSLDMAQLESRVADLTAILDAQAPALAGVDRARIGVLGHSFGAVTAGRIAQVDPRIRAAVGLAAPMENPFIRGVTLAEVVQPLLFLVAKEDNSITEFGNMFIRTNFAEAPAEAWKLEVTDAGHWSVSDLVGLVPAFAPGCGTGKRQDDASDFRYLDPSTGRTITASYVTAFFRATLDDDAGARAYLDRGFPDDEIVSVAHHD